MMKRVLPLLLTLCFLVVPMTIHAESALEPYTFSMYYNYDYWTIRPWGNDETSAYWKDMFNITMEQSKPDADAAAKLNLMIASGDLPDVIQMDRGAEHKRMAELGLFVDLAPLIEVNPIFNEEILASTQELLKIGGTLYSIPHWARKTQTGGNNVWMYDVRLYEAAGKPDLSTFEGLYNYAKTVKEDVKTTQEGLSVIPFAGGNNNDAFDVLTTAFYRSFGGPNKSNSYMARIDGKMQSVLRDPVFKAAVMELNKWYREGLLYENQFSDTNDQMIEKFTSARTALLYYDHSQDDVNHFRQIVQETYPGDSYEVVVDPVYPPAEGVTKVYTDHKETVGWNVLCITTKAKEPQRIFDFFSYKLTKQGSVEMMYGPQGDWWDELNENGDPILKYADNELTSSDKDRIGTWFWNFLNHSDNVDNTKFAVNEALDADKRNWVISTQANVLSPIMFMSDEYVGLNTTVDQLSDAGINRTLCEDQYRAELPKIIMAQSAEESSKLFDELLSFFDANGFAEVEAAYDARHQELVAIQGYTSYDQE